MNVVDEERETEIEKCLSKVFAGSARVDHGIEREKERERERNHREKEERMRE